MQIHDDNIQRPTQTYSLHQSMRLISLKGKGKYADASFGTLPKDCFAQHVDKMWIQF